MTEQGSFEPAFPSIETLTVKDGDTVVASYRRAYRVVRVPGTTTPESASCDDSACDWEYEGDRSIIEAKAHTLETGHDTVVWSSKAAWYSRR